MGESVTEKTELKLCRREKNNGFAVGAVHHAPRGDIIICEYNAFVLRRSGQNHHKKVCAPGTVLIGYRRTN